MKLATKLLAQSGTAIAVSAIIIGASTAHGATMDAVEGPQKEKVTAPPGRPSADDPLEERIKRAIEEIDQRGQTVLEELGELDSSEKIDRAEQVLEQMDRAAREVKSRAHDRASERLQELNDIAVARVQHNARAELRELGELDSEEKRRRAAEIRARSSEQRERLDSRWERLRERLQHRHQQRELPEFTLRQPSGRPPEHAIALGLRARQEDPSAEAVETRVRQLEQEARFALNNLGWLDTPEKRERARRIQSDLEDRVEELRGNLANSAREQFEHQLEQQIQNLRLRADAAVKELGELDTPEKQERAESIRAKFEAQVGQLRARLANRAQDAFGEQFEQEARELRRRAQSALDELGEADTPEKRELARNIRTRLEEQLSDLRERLSDRTRLTFQEQLEQETSQLRRRAQAALEKLGELDTPEKQAMARRIRSNLEVQMQSARVRLSHQAVNSHDERFEQEAEELRRRAHAALKDLGRLDSLDKVERARQIRARLDDDINLLKRQRARQLREGTDHRSDPGTDARQDLVRDALTDRTRDSIRTDLQDQRDRAAEIRDRTLDALREYQGHRDRLENQVDNLRDRLPDRTRQVISQNPGPTSTGARTPPASDTPPATPEPEREETRPADERPESDGSTSDSTGDSGGRP